MHYYTRHRHQMQPLLVSISAATSVLPHHSYSHASAAHLCSHQHPSLKNLPALNFLHYKSIYIPPQILLPKPCKLPFQIAPNAQIRNQSSDLPFFRLLTSSIRSVNINKETSKSIERCGTIIMRAIRGRKRVQMRARASSFAERSPWVFHMRCWGPVPRTRTAKEAWCDCLGLRR